MSRLGTVSDAERPACVLDSAQYTAAILYAVYGEALLDDFLMPYLFDGKKFDSADEIVAEFMTAYARVTQYWGSEEARFDDDNLSAYRRAVKGMDACGGGTGQHQWNTLRKTVEAYVRENLPDSESELSDVSDNARDQLGDALTPDLDEAELARRAAEAERRAEQVRKYAEAQEKKGKLKVAKRALTGRIKAKRQELQGLTLSILQQKREIDRLQEAANALQFDVVKKLQAYAARQGATERTGEEVFGDRGDGGDRVLTFDAGADFLQSVLERDPNIEDAFQEKLGEVVAAKETLQIAIEAKRCLELVIDELSKEIDAIQAEIDGL